MNEKKEKINQEVEATLSSLDKLDRVEASPFLFTGIIQKMEKAPKQSFLSVQMIVPAMMVTLLLVINVFTIYRVINEEAIQNRAAYIEELAEEYALNENEMDLSRFYSRK